MKNCKKIILPLSIFILLTVSEMLMSKIEILRYADEAVAVFFIIYITIKLTISKIKVSKDIFQIIIASIIVAVIGFLSNILWNIQNNQFAIMVDALATFKLIICCLGFYFMLSKESVKYIIKILVNPAKLLLIIGFVFSIVSLFVDVGMRGQQRFGIYGFNFIFEYAHIYSMFIILCVIIIFLNNNNSFSKEKKYLFFAFVQMILTTKGPSIIWVPMVIIFLKYFKTRNKINVKLILGLLIISVLLGGYQIQNYFLKENAPRAVLYKYGVLTSNVYFPLGSGFSTYGSDMAAKYYSPLYEQYGFNHKYGMKNNENLFLNDNYWPMILGQFGWLGICIFLFIAYKFFYIIQKAKLEFYVKAIIFSAYFYTMIHSLGSSTFTTSMTIILYTGIIMALKLKKEEERGNVDE